MTYPLQILPRVDQTA